MKSPSLAKRLQHLTNNLLATGLILVVGLALGREVIHGWWRSREPLALPAVEQATLPGFAWRAPGGAHWRSSSFAGPRDQAIEALKSLCLALPAAGPEAAPLGTISSEALLEAKRLSSDETAEFYLQDDGFPMIVGVARVASAEATDQERRVICWALAMPARDGQPPADEEADDEPAITNDEPIMHWTLNICAATAPQGDGL